MASIISQQSIQDVLHTARILDILQSTVELRRSGRGYVGLCPFHEEKSPSFSVSEEKNLYHCFGCGASGNVITFLKEKEGMNFPEAIETLAGQYNIHLTFEQKGNYQSDTSELFKINDHFQRAFVSAFLSTDGKDAREYLQLRGFSESVMLTWGLGFASTANSNMVDSLRRNELDANQAVTLGLLYDNLNLKFRNRLTIPIYDHRKRLVGFGTRTLGDDKPKYINSPESAIYQKRFVLYGLSQAKKDIRSQNYAIVCEGYFDVLTLASAGIKNAVACSGTSLTHQQLELLRRFTKRVLYVFDGDEAGTKAALRSLSISLESEVEAKVLILPSGSDPDSYIREHGKSKFKTLCTESIPILEFFIGFHLKKDRSPRAVAELASNVAGILSKLKNPVQRELYLKSSAQLMGISTVSFLSLCDKTSDALAASAEIKTYQKFDNRILPREEVLLLKLAILDRTFIEKIVKTDVLSTFQSDLCKRLGEQLFELNQSNPEVEPSQLIQQIRDQNQKKFYAKLIVENKEFEQTDYLKVFDDCISRLQKKWIDFHKKKISEEIQQAELTGDYNRVFELLETKKKLIKDKTHAS